MLRINQTAAIAALVTVSAIAGAQDKSYTPSAHTTDLSLSGSFVSVSSGGTTLTEAATAIKYGVFTSPTFEWRIGGSLAYENGGGVDETAYGLSFGPKFYFGNSGSTQPYLYVDALVAYANANASGGGSASSTSEGFDAGIGVEFLLHPTSGLFFEAGYTEEYSSGASASEVGLTFGVFVRF